MIVEADGRVVDILPEELAGDDIMLLKGMLSPGLINSHCHLELSHMKNIIPSHTGLIDFLLTVVEKRQHPMEQILDSITDAEQEMYNDGIVAVGDIANNTNTITTKNNSSIAWNNFIETICLTDSNAEKNIEHYNSILKAFQEGLIANKLSSSNLVPHAPYTVSAKTLDMINERTENQVVSMHNQENNAENELFQTGGGTFMRLYNKFGMEESPMPVSGKSSLQTWLPHFNRNQHMILVHNTFISEDDLLFAQTHAEQYLSGLSYCLCINANLYIENTVPPIDLIFKHNKQISLGTDSYSSNWQLSISHEIRTIRKHFPHIPLQLIMQWATVNGARALNRAEELGSFETGKKPGIVLFDEELKSKRIL